jgi:carboxymethylproline synthase
MESILSKQHHDNGVFQLTFNHQKAQNPFSRILTQELISLVPEINQNDAIKSVILTGGVDRSFSVGGDFRDIQALKQEPEMKAYLLEIIDLYQALLSIEKPVICGIDHFCIGQGLQVMMMGDWKVASTRSQYSMPELKNGVACPLGACLLEHFYGRALMMDWVIGCGHFNASKALQHQLVNEVVEANELLDQCMVRAGQLAQFQSIPYRYTKKIHNQRLIDKLEDIRIVSAEAHYQSFLAQCNQAHFDKILNQ